MASWMTGPPHLVRGVACRACEALGAAERHLGRETQKAVREHYIAIKAVYGHACEDRGAVEKREKELGR